MKFKCIGPYYEQNIAFVELYLKALNSIEAVSLCCNYDFGSFLCSHRCHFSGKSRLLRDSFSFRPFVKYIRLS
jgi:hypothetical protein